jgi:yecA family protein
LHKKLAKFLVSDKRPEGTMSLPEVYGFLFTVCTAPEPVETAEWMEVVFNSKDPNYKSEEKQGKIEMSLLEVFAEVNALVQYDEPPLPEIIELLGIIGVRYK